jgi:hypothetical protein
MRREEESEESAGRGKSSNVRRRTFLSSRFAQIFLHETQTTPMFCHEIERVREKPIERGKGRGWRAGRKVKKREKKKNS